MNGRRILTLLAPACLATALLAGAASPVAAANTPPPTQRPHPKGTPAPKKPHPVLNQALPRGFNRLDIQTVPPVPGAQFKFADATITTDKAGIASMLITPAQRLLLLDDRTAHLDAVTQVVEVEPGKKRAQFTGWFGIGTSYKSGVQSEIATFEFEYLTHFNFTNLKGREVAPSLMSSMQLQSSIGETVDLDRPDPVWLQGTQLTTGSNGPVSKDISYKINRVVVAGSNVVNSAQQRFIPSKEQLASVKLLFYSVRFVAADAMFGGGIGKGIDLQYPDGKTRNIPFAKGHAITVDDLPRGDYHVTVVGGGLRMARPVSVSRNSEADLDVISFLDVAVVGVALLVLALAILWFGLQLRRRHRGYNRRLERQARRDRQAAQQSVPGAAAAVERP
jgi:hypothetical protein